MRALRRQDSIAIAVSGGLDSSILAALIAQHADVTVQLVTVSVPGAVDSQRARLLAEHLGRPLLEVVMTAPRLEALLPEIVPLIGTSRVDPARAQEWGIPPESAFVSPLLTGWEVPLFVAAREARPYAKRLVVGQGADEWFGGYARYAGLEGDELILALDRDREALDRDVLPVEARIGKHHAVQVHYPYLDAGVRGVARNLPPSALVDGADRKVALREVARILGLPEAIVSVPKTAAQYGSGVAGLLAGLAKKAGLHQNEYLTRMLTSAGSASSTTSARSA
ncbi:MAG: hypothetical protein HYT80_04325 [Euryarchaeota archaeon]|nr:hypothetical protein [Euryarchaeota archaeon]